MLCRTQGGSGLTFPLYPGSGRVLTVASGPVLLPEAVPVTGIDIGLGSSPDLALQKRA